MPETTNHTKTMNLLGYSLINLDRWKYFSGLGPNSLTNSMLTGLEHQSILKSMMELQAYRYDVGSLVRKYYKDPLFRLECLAELQKKPGSHNLPKGIDQTGNHLMVLERCIKEFTENVLPSVDAWGGEFASKYAGFAAFPKGPQFYEQGHRFVEIDSTDDGSVWASWFYTFSVETAWEPVFCIQIKPLEVLSWIFFLYGEQGFPEQCAHTNKHVEMLKELKWAYQRLGSVEGFFRIAKNYFKWHEIGHTLLFNGKRPVLDVLESFGFSKNDVFPVTNFPSDYHLGAWDRIKQGKKNVADVLFLIGDLCANMTLLSAGVDEPTLAILRAFNWFLVRRPGPKMRPRGYASLLAYSSIPNGEQLFLNDLTDILKCLRSYNGNLPELLISIECRNWNTLAIG